MSSVDSRGPGEIGAEADVEVASLLAKLRVDGEAGPDELAVVEQALGLYGQRQVVTDGRAVRLDTGCECSAPCWAGVPEAARPDDQLAGISVPFIGRDYSSARLCAVGINHHDFGGLGANWWVCRGHIARLRAGGRQNFSYGGGSYLFALLAAAAGEAIPETWPAPEVAVAGWYAAAFVEAVKCSPFRGASEPTEAMWSNCPRHFLGAELRLLAPRTVVVLGRGAAVGLLRGMFELELVDQRPGLERLRGSVDGRTTDFFCCNHPSRPNWHASYPALVQSLRDAGI